MKTIYKVLAIILLFPIVGYASVDLKQSTATTVVVGPFVSDEGVALATVTVTGINAQLYKGSTRTQLTVTASGGDNDCVHTYNGYYTFELTAGNTDTLGSAKLTLSASGALEVFHNYRILTSNIYDTYYGTDKIDTNVTSISDYSVASPNDLKAGTDSVTVTTNSDKTGYSIDTNNDKTGYSLASTDMNVVSVGGYSTASPNDLKAGTDSVTVTTNSDKTGYSIDTNNDKTGYSLTSTDMNVISVGGYSTASPNDLKAGTDSVTVTTNSDKTGYSIDTNNDKTGYSLASTDMNVVSVGGYSTASPNDLKAATDDLSTFDYTTDQVTVGTNNDKTGYTASTVSDKTGYSLASTDMNVVTVGGFSVASPNDLKAGTDSVTVTTNSDKTGYSIDTNNDKTGYSLASTDMNVVSVNDYSVASPNDLKASTDTLSTFNPLVDNVTTEVSLDKTGYSVSSADVNVITVGGFSVASPNDLKAGTDSVTVTTNSDKTGYSIDTNNDKTGYSLASTDMNLISVNDFSVASPNDLKAGTDSVTVTTNNDKTGYSLTSTDMNVVSINDYSVASPNDLKASTDTLSTFNPLVDNVTTEINLDKTGYALTSMDVNLITVNDYSVASPNDLKASTDTLSTFDPSISSVTAVTATVTDISTPSLAKFITVDTGETVAVAGSVAKIAQGSAGGSVDVASINGFSVASPNDLKAGTGAVTVASVATAALAQFITVDTGEGTAATNSVAKVAQGSAGGSVDVTSINGFSIASPQDLKAATETLSTFNPLVDNVTVEVNLDSSTDVNLVTVGGFTVSSPNDLKAATDDVTVGTNNDKTGYTVSTVSDKTGYSLASTDMNVVSVNDYSVASPNDLKAGTDSVTVTTNNDKTGYTVSTVSDKTGYSLASTDMNVVSVNSYSVASPNDLKASTDTLSTFDYTSNQVTVATNNDKTGYTLSATDAIVTDISTAALAKFVTVDTGESSAVSGSVAELAQGSAGGSVDVTSVNGYSVASPNDLKASTDTLSTFDYTSNEVTVATNNDKTGYTVSTVSDKTGYSLASTDMNVISVGGYSTASPNDLKAGTDSVTVTTNNDKTGYSIDTNNDKTGYTVSTVSDKTGYSIDTNNDKTGYSLTSTDMNMVTVNGYSVASPNDLKASTSTLSTFDYTSNQVTVATNNDKTGYTVSTVSDKTGYSLASTDMNLITVNGYSVASPNDLKAGTSAVTVASIDVAALAKFVTQDTGETVAVSGSVAKIAQGAAGMTVADIWNATAALYDSAGSMGELQNDAGAATDPLLNTVPGSYSSGTAGYVLGSISSAIITIESPVAADGDLTIIQGDDYYSADGRALEWTNTDGTWPDLTSASITFACSDIIKSGTVVTPTGSQKVRVELSSTDTATVSGVHVYDVQATLSSGRKVTLVMGTTTFTEDVSP